MTLPLKAFGIALVSLAPQALAQDPITFTIDQAASQWTWSGTSSLGPILGNPSNQFGLLGTQVAQLENGVNPIETLLLAPGGTAMVMPDIAALIPNPIPIFPPLATLEIADLSLQFTTLQAVSVTPGGAFTADVVTSALSGTVEIAPLVGTPTSMDLTGISGTPISITGSLVQTGDMIRLEANLVGSFSFDDPVNGVSAMIDLSGTLAADWMCPTPSSFCSAVANSTGTSAITAAFGSTRIQDANFELATSGLPNGQFAYYLASRDTGFVPGPGGSQGNLCLAGMIGRFTNQIGQVSNGQFAIPVDLTALPLGATVAVQPGETWHFQCWYRDANPGPTSNFSTGLRVTFCP